MKISFRKIAHVYKPTGEFPWSRSHAQVPFPLRLDDGNIRIFFATRDEQSRSSVGFVDVDGNDPSKVIYVSSAASYAHGTPGTFDDSGTMPSWFTREDDKLVLYYTGWNKSDSASYRLSIGKAESSDDGKTFTRCFEGPVLDRGPYDPIWVGQPCVLKEDGTFKMWYLSCEKIVPINNHPEPCYNVKYATSKDGINWIRENKICIPFDSNTDAIGRPFVWKHKGLYYMLHSNRKADGYRTVKEAGYRIEASVSEDGVNWKLAGENLFVKSDSGWDDVMNEYASVLPTADENKFWVFYNGNGFGQTGFGLAELTIEN